jgi:hypothetical protein
MPNFINFAFNDNLNEYNCVNLKLQSNVENEAAIIFLMRKSLKNEELIPLFAILPLEQLDLDLLIPGNP